MVERRASIRSPPPPTALSIAEHNFEHSDNLSENGNDQQLTLLDIAKNIAALRSENANILTVVNALRGDNSQLSQKCDILTAELCSLHSKIDEKML